VHTTDQIALNTVTVAGFDATGTEVGSTAVQIGEVIVGSQDLTFRSKMPNDGNWYSDGKIDDFGNTVLRPAGGYLPGAGLGLRQQKGRALRQRPAVLTGGEALRVRKKDPDRARTGRAGQGPWFGPNLPAL
jgi:hypothetical protein